MGADQAFRLTLHAVPWSLRAARVLSQVPGWAHADTNHWRREIVADRAQLYEVRRGVEPIGNLICWISDDADGRTLSMGPAAAIWQGGDLWRRILPIFEARAADLGCARVRLQAGRPGVERRAAAAGYVPEGWYVKELSR